MIIKKEENVVKKKRRRKPIWFKFVRIALGSVNFCYMMKLRICLWSKWAVKAGFEINKSNTFDLFLPDQAGLDCRGSYCSHPFLQAAVVLTAKEVFRALRLQVEEESMVWQLDADFLLGKGRSHIFCQILNKTRKYTMYIDEELWPVQSFASHISRGNFPIAALAVIIFNV